MNVKKLLSVFTSAAVGLSMLLSSGVTQAFASAIDSDAFVPVRYSNQTVTTTVSGDSAVTTTTATTTVIFTTTTTTANDYNCPEYPISGEKVVSINIVDEAAGYSIYGDIDVTARLLTSEDINNDTEGVEIASWNLNEENIQPYALTVPYTVEYEGQLLFIGVYIDNYTDIAYNDIQETLFVFEPLCDDASFMYEVPLEKSYVTTLAPLDYCECCGKDLSEGGGIRSPLGLYICQECSDAGMGGTTTATGTTLAPVSTTTTTNHAEGTGTTTTIATTGTTTAWTGTTTTSTGIFTTTSTPLLVLTTTTSVTEFCDCCGTILYEGEGVRTPLGLLICNNCNEAGAGGTTPPPVTTTTSDEMEYYVSVDSSNAKTNYYIGERLDLTGVKVSGSCSSDEFCGDIFGQELLSLLDSGTVSVDTSEYDSSKAGTYKIYVTFGTAVDYYEVYVIEQYTTTTTTTTTTNTHTTPKLVKCDGCGYGAFEYNGTYTEDGFFYCYECAEAGVGGGTTTTTTVTTTTTPTVCYNTLLEYDDSEMTVGETRAVYFFNANSGVGEEPFIGEASENISYEYVEGTNVIYITALAPGEAKLYIREGTCAFGAYVKINVTDGESVPVTKYGDINNDGEVKMDDVIRVMCYASNSEKFPMDAQGRANGDVYQTGDGVDISDALMIQKLVAQIITDLTPAIE